MNRVTLSITRCPARALRLRTTPAMATGIADHIWSARELLTHNFLS